MLNTRQTRKLVRGMLALKKCYIWGTWTEQAVRKGRVDSKLRNIGFGVGGERLTAADCRWLRFATGCKRVHVTDGGYVRLVHVAYEN